MAVIGLYLERSEFRTYRLIEGVLKYATEQGSVVLRDYLFDTDPFCEPNSEETLRMTSPPWTNQVDGVITSLAKERFIIEWLDRGNVPYVMACGDFALSGIPCVYTDVDSISQIALNHVRSLNYKHVGFVGYKDSDTSHQRLVSLAQYCRRYGMTFQAYEMDKYLSFLVSKRTAEIPAEAGLVTMLQQLPKPACIITMNNHYAIAIISAIRKLGLGVPGEVAVIGVDDSELSGLYEFPITCVHHPTLQIGFQSARQLMRLMDGKRLAPKVLSIPAEEISIHESTVGLQRAVVTDIDRAKEFIRRRACEGIRVADVANYLHIPLRTLQLEFKSHTGATVEDEIRRIRFESACKLLETTDFTLERIARQIGMSRSASFNVFFRRMAGMTPNAYRRQNRQE